MMAIILNSKHTVININHKAQNPFAHYVHAKVQVVSHWPLTLEVWVCTRVSPSRFVVDKVELGQVLL
jgi:hypothetical protein